VMIEGEDAAEVKELCEALSREVENALQALETSA